MLRRILVAITLATLLELPLWPRTGASAKGSDGPNGAAAGLHLLETQYSRTLLQLDGVTLDTMPTGAITLGPVTNQPTLTPPTIVASPSGSVFAVITQRCPGCQTPVPVKYITVRVVNRRGVVLHHFHPGANLFISAISDDASRISGWGEQGPSAGYAPAWYTLSGTTGRVLQTFTLPTDWPLYDPVHDRVYTYTVTGNHRLQFSTYSAATGRPLAQITIPDIAAGMWNTDQQSHGLPVTRINDPGMALSPDGSQLVIYDGQTEKLITVDAPTLRILRTQTVTRPQSLIDRVLGVLGIAPTVAQAKEVPEGMSLNAQFGNDGHTLYVTGDVYAPDSNGLPSSQSIGIERIDLTSGQLTASALKGEDIRWLSEGADGQALYALSPEDHGFCPCALRRLDPVSLQTTAQRMIPLDWNLQLFVLHDPNG